MEVLDLVISPKIRFSVGRLKSHTRLDRDSFMALAGSKSHDVSSGQLAAYEL